MATESQLVLVTGGSGFVGSHCILLALQRGYRVRTTVRSLARGDDVRKMLTAGGASEDQANSVEFCAADLMKDEGWSQACKDCTYVLHVASPFPSTVPKNEDDLIVPAREGTLSVLRAAKAAGTVNRIVVTSSFAAIGYGHGDRGSERPFTEADWTQLDAGYVAPYQKSKTIAEKAAWDWLAKEGGELEMSVVNPVGIFGPILSKDYATSIELVTRLVNGQVPGLPQIHFGCVDVRDVADLELRAMTDERAKSERFIAVSEDGFLSMQDFATKLRTGMGEKGKKVPTRTLPNILLRLYGFIDKQVGSIVPELGKPKTAFPTKAIETLGWKPRNAEESLISCAQSCDKFGLLK